MAGKAKVVDEVWNDDRIKGFLEYKPPATDSEPDFEILYRAYKYMRADDFARFLVFFVDAGHSLNACDQRGRKLVDIISQHRFSAAFVQSLIAAGSRVPRTEEGETQASKAVLSQSQPSVKVADA